MSELEQVLAVGKNLDCVAIVTLGDEELMHAQAFCRAVTPRPGKGDTVLPLYEVNMVALE